MTHHDNIAAVYAAATSAQHDAGIGWYNRAHELAWELSPSDVWRGAGIIAAFSPLTPWWRNEELARASAFSGIARRDTLSNSANNAQRIIDGEHPLEVLKGDKTSAFCENIALDGFSDAVTVDVHAFSIAMGEPIPSSKLKMGKVLYREIAQAYRDVANEAGLMPTQMQAITWVTWRDRYPKKAARKGEKIADS